MGSRKGIENLSDEDIETAAAAYMRTGSYVKAAQSIGRHPNTVRYALLRHGVVKAAVAERHAIAVEAGVRRAGRVLAGVLKQAEKYVDAERHLGVMLEPHHFASVANAVSKAVDTSLNMHAHTVSMEEKAARIERTKAETELVRARIRGDAPSEVQVLSVDEQTLDDLMRRKFGTAGVAYSHGTPTESPASLARDVPAVSAEVGVRASQDGSDGEVPPDRD